MNINDTVSRANQEIQGQDFERFLTLVDESKFDVYESLRNEIGDVESKILLLKLTNLLVAKYEYSHRHTRLISYPINLIVDPTNACGLHCPGCVHSKTPSATEAFLWPSGHMTEQKFGKFIQEYGPYALQVIFANYGEPLLNRLTPQFISTTREYLVETVSSTSLSVKKLDVDLLVLSGLDSLILSIDGATKETYSIYRRGGDFDLVVSNVAQLVAAKKKHNAYAPFLAWQFLVFEHNFHEIEKVNRLAQSIGVNELRLVKPGSVAWDDPSIVVKDSFEGYVITYDYSFMQDRNNHNMMLANLNRQVVDRHFSRRWLDRYKQINANLRQGSVNRRPACQWLYKSITIDGLGNVMPCCMAPSRDRELVYSSVGVADPYNSDMYVTSRAHFLNEGEHEIQINGVDSESKPYCTFCSFQEEAKPLITPLHAKNYLEKVSIFGVLSGEAKSVLADW